MTHLGCITSFVISLIIILLALLGFQINRAPHLRLIDFPKKLARFPLIPASINNTLQDLELVLILELPQLDLPLALNSRLGLFQIAAQLLDFFLLFEDLVD